MTKELEVIKGALESAQRYMLNADPNVLTTAKIVHAINELETLRRDYILVRKSDVQKARGLRPNKEYTHGYTSGYLSGLHDGLDAITMPAAKLLVGGE